ncbi:terminase large subunit [Brucella anthropi]|uniref:terminase large subunit n=1 Tax=Brucella anthropi TaxID=529 RepID=UPI0005BC33DE|nr:terminase large subunit [Brucella anthropi]KIU68429.1 terminase [Brucella anthropi]
MAKPVWSTACPDWEARIIARQSLVPFEPLFPDEAEAALKVFKSLRIVDVAGQPTFGEACEEYVFDFVKAIFGAYDAESGHRLIEEFMLLISKKNIKSTLAAGIMLTALIRNWRHSQELTILAPTREVADNSFRPAADMVAVDPVLRDLLHVNMNTKEIKHRVTNAVLKVISADSATSAGKKSGMVLVEELWLFGKKNNAAAMLQEATGGLIARPEGFVIYLTTQSDMPPAGVFKQKLDYFRDVRDGVIDDPRSLPVLYEFPKKMVENNDYLKPENFYVTNPNMGRSVRREWLERKFLQVQSGQDEEGDTIQTFLAKHLNVEIGMNLRANRWPGADFWAKRANPEITLEYLYDHCDVIVPGLDGGGLDDLYGFAALGRHKVTRDWLLWTHAWCHKGVLDRRKTIADRLRDFAKAGELTIVEDELDDISAIVEIIAEIKQRGLLAAVAVDPAGLGEMIEALDEIGVTQEEGLLVGAPQGYAMMNAIKTAERKLTNGTLKHSGSKLMSWCVSNLKIEPTATAIRATKQNAGDAKIDPVMALFDAVTVMSRNPEVKRAKTYQMMFV